MRWLIFDSTAAAQARSQAAWAAKLGHAPDAGAGTTQLWGVVAHPSNGQAALEIPDDDDLAQLSGDERALVVETLSSDWLQPPRG